jgi:DNA-binding response OmpR family regulator
MPCKVLIADDDADSADALAVLVGMDGHTVTTAYSAADTLALIDEFVPDVAVLDIAMPDINGYEIAQRIRERHGASVMLIAVTGLDTHWDIERARTAGFAHHCSKPLDFEKLRALISEIESDKLR